MSNIEQRRGMGYVERLALGTGSIEVWVGAYRVLEHKVIFLSEARMVYLHTGSPDYAALVRCDLTQARASLSKIHTSILLFDARTIYDCDAARMFFNRAKFHPDYDVDGILRQVHDVAA